MVGRGIPEVQQDSAMAPTTRKPKVVPSIASEIQGTHQGTHQEASAPSEKNEMVLPVATYWDSDARNMFAPNQIMVDVKF